MSDFEDVGRFHRRFGLPHLGDGRAPALLTEDEWEFRRRFLQEELDEADRAHREGDLAGFLDGLVDLCYVAMGTAQLAALPFDQAWAEVQRANLTKERATGAADPRSKRGHALDVVKPIGWRGPDVAAVLRAAGWKGCR